MPRTLKDLKTHADEIVDLASRINREAVALAGTDHTPDDLKVLLTHLGAAVEVFLKAHVYVGAHNNWTFEKLIDGLEPFGVAQGTRGHLHSLRVLYNRAKHDPSWDAPIREVFAALSNSNQGLNVLRGLSLGDTSQPAFKTVRRLLWFAAWDHYIGGDTEIGVFLPTEPDVQMPRRIETIYVKTENWEEVKQELAAVGCVCFGEQCLPLAPYSFWASEGDFLEAGTFEGDLREMIGVFARHERVEDILSYLKRENDEHSMLAAALFALTDVSQSGAVPEVAEDLAASLLTAASTRYAAPATSRPLKTFAGLISKMVVSCRSRLCTPLTGPRWVSAKRYVEMAGDSVSAIDQPPVMILKDGAVIVRA